MPKLFFATKEESMKTSLGILIFFVSLVMEGCIIVSIAQAISGAGFPSMALQNFGHQKLKR